MSIQQRNSTSPIDGSLYSGLLQPNALYISESDGRNNPQFINDYPGTVYVLSQSDFAKWLQREVGSDVDIPDAVTGEIPNGSRSREEIENATFLSDPRFVPTNLKWDAEDPDSVHYLSSDSGIYLNVKIEFDSAPDDLDNDAYTYYVHYEPGVLSGDDNTDHGSSTKAPISGIQVNATSASLTASWDQLPNATRYAVQVIGANLPDSSGSAVADYAFEASGRDLGSSTNRATLTQVRGFYTFELVKGSTSFSGTYTIGVKAIYQSGSSTEVSSSDAV
jgi:hypothetical protein